VLVRALLGSGNLTPLQSQTVWAGHGPGRSSCYICRQSLERSDVELEAEQSDQGSVGCHVICFGVWQDESRNFPADTREAGPAPRTPEGENRAFSP
jgi:hypothetical protein